MKNKTAKAVAAMGIVGASFSTVSCTSTDTTTLRSQVRPSTSEILMPKGGNIPSNDVVPNMQGLQQASAAYNLKRGTVINNTHIQNLIVVPTMQSLQEMSSSSAISLSYGDPASMAFRGRKAIVPLKYRFEGVISDEKSSLDYVRSLIRDNGYDIKVYFMPKVNEIILFGKNPEVTEILRQIKQRLVMH